MPGDGTILAELHVHLEGTVRRETAIELARAHGLPAPPPYSYSDLEGFMRVYQPVAQSMRTKADFERVIGEHAAEMARQRIKYAEISFNPSLHAGEEWVGGLARGRALARAMHGVEIRWLVELVREASAEANERALDIALTTEGVVGLGLVGDETFSLRPLLPLITRAQSQGLGFMPHAGQVGGPEVVRQAIDAGARRIAHGVAAAADPSVASELAARKVCLCVCPSSNRRIGVEPDLRTLAAHGIQMCLNTDDPAMVPSTLEAELEIGVRESRLPRLALVAAAWANRFGPATLPLNNSVK